MGQGETRRQEVERLRKSGKNIPLTHLEAKQWEFAMFGNPHMRHIDGDGDKRAYDRRWDPARPEAEQYSEMLDYRTVLLLRPLNQLYLPLMGYDGKAFSPIKELAKEFILIQGEKGDEYTPQSVIYQPEGETYKFFWKDWAYRIDSGITLTAQESSIPVISDGVGHTIDLGGSLFWESLLRPLHILRRWHFDIYGLIEKGIAEPVKSEHNTVAYSAISDSAAKKGLSTIAPPVLQKYANPTAKNENPPKC